MNYAFEEIEQKNSTESPLFCLQNLALENNSIWSRPFASSKQNLHKITWTLAITAKHFKLHRWTLSFLRCPGHLVRAFAILQSFSMKVNLEVNNVAPVFTRGLTFVIESSIIIVDDVNDENALISYSEYTVGLEVRIDLENSIGNVTTFRLKLRVPLDKREENDHIFFTDISNHRLAHSLNSRKLFRTAKAQRCKKRARQANSKEKRTQRAERRRKAVTRRRTRTTRTDSAVFGLLAVESRRFLCLICFEDDIEIVRLCDHDFCRECQQKWRAMSVSCAMCKRSMKKSIRLFTWYWERLRRLQASARFLDERQARSMLLFWQYFVRRLSRRQFQCRQIVLNSVSETFTQSFVSRSCDCQSRTFTQFSEFLLLTWFSILASHVLSQFAVKKCCRQVSHIVMILESEIVHPRHNLPYHWGSWHTSSFVLGWRHRVARIRIAFT